MPLFLIGEKHPDDSSSKLIGVVEAESQEVIDKALAEIVLSPTALPYRSLEWSAREIKPRQLDKEVRILIGELGRSLKSAEEHIRQATDKSHEVGKRLVALVNNVEDHWRFDDLPDGVDDDG